MSHNKKVIPTEIEDERTQKIKVKKHDHIVIFELRSDIQQYGFNY